MTNSANNKIKEVWKDIPGFEGRYQASNLGRIRSLDYTVKYKNTDFMAHRKGRILSAKTDKYGYLAVTLCMNKRYFYKTVHQLVASTFLPNPNHYPFINHINENKKDNTVWINSDGSIDFTKTNLEWCTPKYNIEEYHNKRIVVYQYDTDGAFIRTWNSVLKAAESVSGFISGVHHCCSGDCKTYKGFIWTFSPLTSSGLAYRKSNKHSPQIEQLDLSGNVLNRFDNLSEAARLTGSNYTSISSVCAGKYKSANGYKWRKVINNE